LPQFLTAGSASQACFPSNFVEDPRRKLILLSNGKALGRFKRLF
jgi:hypothetical protein